MVSHPDDLIAVLNDAASRIERIGLEAGPCQGWLAGDLIETRHIKSFLKFQPNKSDRNDACGIAQMMRVNLYRLVNAKTLTSQSGGRC
ncbi:hypothetical protein NKH73_30955 [Mesorhizobium sp. M0938]|uniref:hypothetical protein n=1 Tax=unclassified Mesorhizobium TaxID=325217 RepID=UPI003338FB23